MSKSREKWNSRYRSRTRPAPTPPHFLVQVKDQLKPGSVLDVAAGDGAASLWLAAQGFEVTALDIAEEGLKRLQSFAEADDLPINTVQADLEQTGALDDLGKFNNAVIALYKPVDGFWAELTDHLTSGAIVLLTTFNLEHHQHTGFSRRFCLSPNELANVHPGLSLLEYCQTELDGNWMDHYLFSYQA